MDTVNTLLTSVGDLLLAPFRGRPATGLVFWSAVTGILMAYAIGKTSNQQALRRAADGVRAQLLAIKLFKEDLVVTFQCQIALFRSTGMRLWHSIPPMLFMTLPLLLIVTQLAMRYEYRPLVPGEQAVVAMHIKPDHWKELRDLALNGGDRFAVETDSLRDEQSSTIYWRVRAIGGESEPLEWQLDGSTIRKELPMSKTPNLLVVANPKRPGAAIGERFLHPAEESLAAVSPIESIDVQLVPRETPIFGWNIPWWATFFLVSMAVALAAGKFMGVQF